MVSPIVKLPWVSGITFRYLLAHAEQPDLLAECGISELEEFAKRDGSALYTEFIHDTSRVPSFEEGTEARLLNDRVTVPQVDFKAVLDRFKELTGIRNPFDFRLLGRVIPTVNSGVTKLAATAVGPAMVLRQSPNYNDKFNNDQRIEIVPQTFRKRDGRVDATVLHYILPSTCDPYLEMVTAALGYWEGIPRLWDWDEWGETRLHDIQIPLEDLLKNDFAYLDLRFEERGKDVLLNGVTRGKRMSIEDTLTYTPNPRYIVRDTAKHSPIQITEDVEVDGRVIFPKGMLFGMPASRYDVSVPLPGLRRRVWYATRSIGRATGRLFGIRSESKYLFLGKSSTEVALSDAVRESHIAQVRELEARASEAEARAEAAQATARAEYLVQIGQVRSALVDGVAHGLGNLHSDTAGEDKFALYEITARNLIIAKIFGKNPSMGFIGEFVSALESELEVDIPSSGGEAAVSNLADDLAGAVVMYGNTEVSRAYRAAIGKVKSELGPLERFVLDSMVAPLTIYQSEGNLGERIADLLTELTASLSTHHFSVRSVMEDAFERSKREYAGKLEQEVEYSITCDPNLELHANVASTRRVWQDIINNSLRSYESQKVTPHINLQAGRFDELSAQEQARFKGNFPDAPTPLLYLEFVDGGYGMNPDLASDIMFNANTRGEIRNTSTREMGGNKGVGPLRTWLDNLGGMYECRSINPEQERGTMVRIYLTNDEVYTPGAKSL